MKKYISKYVKYILPSIFIIISIVTYNMGGKKQEVIFLNKNTNYFSVYVKGAIKNEKTVKVKKNTSLQDVINLCGGIKEEADISNLDLKRKVNDGDIIEIPSKIEKINNNEESIEMGDKVNINIADKNTLMNLTGIGEKTAEKIIDYRKENKFKNIEDIKNVSGIGDKKYEKIKNNITV